MSFGLSADGFTAARQSDFLTVIRDDLDARLTALGFTTLPDYERDTFLGNVTEIMAYQLGQLSEALQAVYDARSVGNATGLQLDNLALIVGVPRNEATYSTAPVTLTGTNGTVIPAGKIVQGGGEDGTAQWVFTESVTISGTTSATVRAVDKGEIVATAGQITTIVTPVDGWTGVTNSGSTPGNERETDAELRVRRTLAIAAAASTSTNAILSELLQLDFVTGAVVLDNPTGTTTVIDGISVDPYGVAAVVAPTSLTTAQQQDVVDAIFARLGAGTATSGSSSGTVTKIDGRAHTINYSLAADSTVNVAWTLLMQTGFVAADVEDELQALVEDYFGTLGPGSTVYPLPLISLASTVTGIANVTQLLLNGTPFAVGHTALQLPVLGTHSVA